MGNKHFYIGIDIGGTKIITALLDKKGEIFYSDTIETKKFLDEKKLIKKLAEIVDDIKTKNSDKLILGIGIGAAGIIDHVKGIIKFSPNIGWRDFNIAKDLKNATKMDVYVDNDANAAAWGIYYLNYSGKLEHFLCVTLGTGIGGGLVLNGKLFRGASSSAGEIGHMTLFPDGIKCSCGNNGCVERYAGTKGIIERTKAYLKNYAGKTIIHDFLDNGEITPRSVGLAAGKGDKLAIKIWHETGSMIGIIFASVVNLLNLEMIYVTGGLAYAEEWLKQPILDELNKRAFDVPAKAAKLVFAKQKKEMGVIGAGLLVVEKHLHLEKNSRL